MIRVWYPNLASGAAAKKPASVAAEGRYMKASLDKIADFDPLENEWRVVSKETDPESIEILLNR